MARSVVRDVPRKAVKTSRNAPVVGERVEPNSERFFRRIRALPCRCQAPPCTPYEGLCGGSSVSRRDDCPSPAASKSAPAGMNLRALRGLADTRSEQQHGAAARFVRTAWGSPFAARTFQQSAGGRTHEVWCVISFM